MIFDILLKKEKSLFCFAKKHFKIKYIKHICNNAVKTIEKLLVPQISICSLLIVSNLVRYKLY